MHRRPGARPPAGTAATANHALAALKRAAREIPGLARALSGLTGLVLARVALRGDPPLPLPPGFAVDTLAFSAGAPALARPDMPVEPAGLARAAGLVIPALIDRQPAAQPGLAALERAATRGKGLFWLVEAWLRGEHAPIAESAPLMSLSRATLDLALAQVASGLAVRLRQAAAPLIERLPWIRGFCPVCGSPPALSFRRGRAGRRLWCAFCGHDWPFRQPACPFCENDAPARLAAFGPEDRPAERAEACLACERWLPAADIGPASAFLPEVALLRLHALEGLARGKGLAGGGGFLDLTRTIGRSVEPD